MKVTKRLMAGGPALLGLMLTMTTVGAQAEGCPGFFDHDYRQLHRNNEINLCEQFAGRPLLVVNTASHCGFTSQFEGLESLHQRYESRGLAVIGFSSNDFNQEADSEEEAASVCYENFGVTFTMMAPTSVRGDDANPLFRELAAATEAPGWNFNKYLISAEGEVVGHFGSRVAPDSDEITQAVEALLD